MPLLVLVLVTALGCGSHGDNEPDVVVGPHTKVLDADTLAKIVRVADDRSTITFSASTPQVDALAADDIIVAPVSHGTPMGLLRRVTSIDRSNGVVVITTPAALTDAFERAHVTLHRDLTPDDLAPKAHTLSGTLHPLGVPGGALTIGVNDIVLYDLDGDANTVQDQVRVSGNVSLNPSIDLMIDIDGFALKEASFTLSGAESASLDLRADGGYTFDESKTIPAFTFAPITVPVGGIPLVFVPDVRMRFGAKATLGARLEMGATESGSFQAGVGYKNGAWGPIHSGDISAQVNPPSIDAKLSAKPYAGPEMNLLLYGAAGPYVDLTGYLALDADPAANPCWSLHAGLDAALGVKVELLGKNVASFDTQVLLDRAITSGACSPSLPPDTFWSKVYSSSTSSPEGASFAPTLDGAFVVVAHSMDLVMKIDGKGNVVWQHEFTGFRDVRTVVALGDGTYVVAGANRIVKLDAAGAVVWSRRYDGATGIALEAHALVATKDGGLFVTGVVQGPQGYPDVWALKTDGNGTPLWSKRIGSAGTEHAEGARETSDGHVIVVGTNGDSQGMALSLASDTGAIAWQWQYGGLATVQYLQAITAAPNGGSLLAGTIPGGPASHGWLVRIGADGSMVNGAYGSVQYLPADPNAAPFEQISVNAITQSQAGDDTYFGTGAIWDGKSTATSKLWTFRVTFGADGTANMDFSRAFDAAGEDDGYAVRQLTDGTLLVGGTSATLGSNPVANVWFLRTEQNGALTFPAGSPVSVENLSGQIFQSSQPPDGGVAPVDVVSSPTSLASADVPVTPTDEPLSTIDTAVQVRSLAP